MHGVSIAWPCMSRVVVVRSYAVAGIGRQPWEVSRRVPSASRRWSHPPPEHRGSAAAPLLACGDYDGSLLRAVDREAPRRAVADLGDPSRGRQSPDEHALSISPSSGATSRPILSRERSSMVETKPSDAAGPLGALGDQRQPSRSRAGLVVPEFSQQPNDPGRVWVVSTMIAGRSRCSNSLRITGRVAATSSSAPTPQAKSSFTGSASRQLMSIPIKCRIPTAWACFTADLRFGRATRLVVDLRTKGTAQGGRASRPALGSGSLASRKLPTASA